LPTRCIGLPTRFLLLLLRYVRDLSRTFNLPKDSGFSPGRFLNVPTPSRIALCMLLLTGTGVVWAQTPGPQPIDLGVTYIAQGLLRASTTQNFWLEGGSAELGLNLWYGVGPVSNFTGGHTGSIGSSGVPLTC
jgi:hypothetical protein